MLSNLFEDLIVFVQRAVHLHIFFNECGNIHLGLLEYLEKHRFDFIFVDGEGRARICTILDLTGADPLAVFVALLVLGLPAVVGSTTVGTEQLTGEQVLMIAYTLTALYIVAASL